MHGENEGSIRERAAFKKVYETCAKLSKQPKNKNKFYKPWLDNEFDDAIQHLWKIWHKYEISYDD
jgi:hypothetical protein